MSDQDIIVRSDVDYEDLIAEMYINGQFIGVLSQDSITCKLSCIEAKARCR